MFLRRFEALLTVTRTALEGGYYSTDRPFVGAQMVLDGKLAFLECGTWETSGALRLGESVVHVEIAFTEDLSEPVGPEIIENVKGAYIGRVHVWEGESGKQKPVGQQAPEGSIHALVMIVLPMTVFPVLYAMREEAIRFRIARDFRGEPDLQSLGFERLVGLVKRVEFEIESNEEEKKRWKLRSFF